MIICFGAAEVEAFSSSFFGAEDAADTADTLATIAASNSFWLRCTVFLISSKCSFSFRLFDFFCSDCSVDVGVILIPLTDCCISHSFSCSEKKFIQNNE